MNRYLRCCSLVVALVYDVSAQPLGSLVINTIAGSGARGDGGPATAAQLLFPANIAVDSNGFLYVADVAIVRRIAPDGTISTFAGTGLSAFSGDGGPASAARIGAIATVTIANGTLYIADVSNERVRAVTPDGNINTIAGAGFGSSGDGGPASAALFNEPFWLAVDSSGSLYISDFGNNRIREITGGTITTIAGRGTGGYNGDGANAKTQELFLPSGLSFDSGGNLYIADRNNNRIRKLTPSGALTTVVGNGSTGVLQLPRDVVVSANGDLYIADQFNYVVRKMTAAGAYSNVAGATGSAGFSGDGTAANLAQLNAPGGLALDGSGNLYIADQYNRRIRKVTTDGLISTIAGAVGNDSTSAAAIRLGAPAGVARAGGSTYIADYYGDVVRKLSPDGTITTIAGTGTLGFSGDGGPATQAQLALPEAVAVDASGNVFIADSGSNRSAA